MQLEFTAEMSRTFNTVAELYDRFRISYPEQLIDILIEKTKICPERSHLLEIASGTGQATRRFARRGYRITCVEQGEEMVAIAKNKLPPSR